MDSQGLLEFGPDRVDTAERTLWREGKRIPLTPKAVDTLIVLVASGGRVVEKEDLIQKVWPDTYVTEANLTQNVSSLRKALGERANDHRYVVTVPGRGYSFVVPVTSLSSPMSGTCSFVVTCPRPNLVWLTCSRCTRRIAIAHGPHPGNATFTVKPLP